MKIMGAAFCAVFLSAGGLRAQAAAPAPSAGASPRWVPFEATLVQETTRRSPAGAKVHARVSGVYVRNSNGSTFSRRTVSSRLPVPGARDVALIYDRPNHTAYITDYINKTVQTVKNPPGVSDPPAAPPSRADFVRQHTADVFLGKRKISGVECEGYLLAGRRRKRYSGWNRGGQEYGGEAWYAPSLNFLLVQYQGPSLDGGDVKELVKDIEPGKDPDPSYFRPPEGFSIVKKALP